MLFKNKTLKDLELGSERFIALSKSQLSRKIPEENKIIVLYFQIPKNIIRASHTYTHLNSHKVIDID